MFIIITTFLIYTDTYMYVCFVLIITENEIIDVSLCIQYIYMGVCVYVPSNVDTVSIQ